MAKVYLSIGSNLGNRVQHLDMALQLLGSKSESVVSKLSSIFETEPWGLRDQPWFLNQVAEVITDLEPHALLEYCQTIELSLERKRAIKWGPRTVDIDILLYNSDRVHTESLKIPHPRIVERNFILKPMIEIAPDALLANNLDFSLDESKEKVIPWHRWPENFGLNKSPIPVLDILDEWTSFSFGLENVKEALERLGNPQLHFKHILVGGTNGKGTVSSSISANYGEKVGLFLSPHVLNIRERINIGNEPVDDYDWQRAYTQILEVARDIPLSYFEWLFVVSVQVFFNKKVDFAVFEVGMGGRLDATNALSPQISVITNVELDHQAFLGNCIESIALEKIEIARNNSSIILPRIIYQYKSVKQRLKSIGAQPVLHEFNSQFKENWGLALKALEHLGKAPIHSRVSILPGRRETFSSEKQIYMDGAHNEAAWVDLVKWVKEDLGLNKMVVIGSLSLGRDPEKFIEILRPITGFIYACNWGFSRELTLDLWPEGVQGIKPSEVLGLVGEKGPLLICGSLYSIAAAKLSLQVLEGSA